MNFGGSVDEPIAIELPAGFVVIDLPVAAGEDAHVVGRRAAEAAIAIVAPDSSLAYDGTRPIVAPASKVSAAASSASSASSACESSSNTASASVSITHTHGRAIALAGRVAHLGVDLVDDADAERIENIAERYFTTHELALCVEHLAYNRVFAAKEAALKALGLGLLDGGAFDRAWPVRVVSLDPPKLDTDGDALVLVIGRAGNATIAVAYR